MARTGVDEKVAETEVGADGDSGRGEGMWTGEWTEVCASVQVEEVWPMRPQV